MEYKLKKDNSFEAENNKHNHVYFVYILLLICFLFSVFLRISTSVVLLEIQKEIPLTLSQIAFVSSVYFYSYGLMQPFVGYLNDNNNPVIVEIIGLSIAEIGIIIFGLCHSFGGLVLSRFLMGLGLSPIFNALIVYQNLKFPVERYSFYLGISMAVGNLGGVVASRPLSFLLSIWGRQNLFIVLFFIIFTIIVFLFLVTEKPFHLKVKFCKDDDKPDYRQVFSIIKKSKDLRRNIIIVIVFSGVITCYQGLWAYSWFKVAFDGNIKRAGIALAFYNGGLILGNLCSTKIFPSSIKRMRNIEISTFLFLILFLALILSFLFNFSYILIVIIATVGGFVCSIGGVQRSSGINDLSPKNLKGSVFGIVNLLIFGFDIIYQTVTGVLLDGFKNWTTLSNAFILTFAIVELTVFIAYIEANKLSKDEKKRLS
ncbi:MAG: MFS transporter [Sphaerochaetaceae bacterium]